MTRTLSMLLSLLLASTLQAQVYEWFDEAGNRHFSDQKPDGVAFRTLGESATNLSSYNASVVRQPRPAVGQDHAASSASGQNRRSPPPARDPEAVCADYLRRIDRIHDRLRAGYDEPTGNRLRAQRSALRAAYLRDCR